MDVFAADTDVVAVVELTDAGGGEVTPDDASHPYAVLDETGAEVTTGTVALVSTDTEASITVPAVSNAITGRRGARTVRLTVAASGSSYVVELTYVLEDVTQLFAVPTNSAQTFAEALMLSIDMPSLDAWEDATDAERKAGLIEAYARMGRMAYKPWRHFEDRPSGDDRVQTLWRGAFRLTDLDASDWDSLPAPFKLALRRAQLVEADVLLDGDPTWDRRVDGLLSKTVGESSEMFRSGKPVITSVSTRAMRELTGFLAHSVKTGR